MGEELGHIVAVDWHPKGPWHRLHLDTGKTIYMRGEALEVLQARYGSPTPPALFIFKTNSFWHQVQAYTEVREPVGLGGPRLGGGHDSLGARLDEIRSALARVGCDDLARDLDVDKFRESMGRETCLVEGRDPEHGAVACVEQRSHAGEHNRQCLSCTLVGGSLREFERRLAR